MLPKKNRMNRVQFEQFGAKAPHSVFNRVGTLKFLPENNLFSVVTSSKHCKKAVFRNKSRRRAYAVIHSIMQQAAIPLSGVLYLSKHAYTIQFVDFKLLIEDLFKRAHDASQ